ncbi:hypothetical protein [Collimonas sp.]|uniref:hypothetical protein n=1 Tax=Collimonas sp. TaxID=1963772 RepID=UPI002BFEAE8E|nr:hypothetical protein [Collimonas sp.]HWX01601.1 hypothetical protein [Collimonas sp.]
MPHNYGGTNFNKALIDKLHVGIYKLAKYITQLADLPPPLDKFPLWRAELESISGAIDRDELLALAHFSLLKR